MSTGLIERLGRYGDDLDAAIDARPDHLLDDAYVRPTTPRRRPVAAVSVAAVSVILAGTIGVAVILTDGDPTERTVATEPTAPIQTAEPESLRGISLRGIDEPIEVDVANPDGGSIQFFAGPGGPVGTRWTAPGAADGAGTAGWREHDDGSPAIIGSSTMPGDDITYVTGAVGANGVAIRVTMDDGSVVERPTLPVPGVPGARVFAVGVVNDRPMARWEVLSSSGEVLFSDEANLVPTAEVLQDHGSGG